MTLHRSDRVRRGRPIVIPVFVLAHLVGCDEGAPTSRDSVDATPHADTAIADTAIADTDAPSADADAETTAPDGAGSDLPEATPTEVALGPCSVTTTDTHVRVTRFTYDAQGRLVASVVRLDGQADDARTERWSYDDAGTLREYRESSRLHGEGGPHYLHRQVWDAAGKLTREEWDRDGDGVLDGWQQMTFEADECSYTMVGDLGQGLLLRRALCDARGDLVHCDEDDDADGVADSNTDMTYDAQGRILTELDAVPYNWEKKTWTYVLGTDGTTTSREALDETVSDGPSVDAVIVKVWDPRFTHTFPEIAYLFPAGLVAQHEDWGNDGAWESSQSLAFDGTEYVAQQLLGEVVETWRFGTDFQLRAHIYHAGHGAPDYRETRSYDASGDLVLIASDGNEDGVPETTDTFTYDVAHRVLTETFTSAGGGSYTKIYEYDSCR